MLKHGNVKLWGPKYDYMYDLENGAYFGEYNIMFGLYSNIHYKVHTYQSKNHFVMIFRIDKRILMNEICKDIDSFTHLHKIALQKFRWNNRVISELDTQNLLKNPPNHRKYPLEEVILLQRSKFAVSPEIDKFYARIEFKLN
jgi:hypothetical protein